VTEVAAHASTDAHIEERRQRAKRAERWSMPMGKERRKHSLLWRRGGQWIRVAWGGG
jgi:hypothetical protein